MNQKEKKALKSIIKTMDRDIVSLSPIDRRRLTKTLNALEELYGFTDNAGFNNFDNNPYSP